MGYIVGLILMPIFAILENSILIDFRLLEGQPSLVLVAVIVWSWHSDLGEAIFWAFVGGISLDVLNPLVPAGVSVIAPLLMIVAVKTIERFFYGASILALVGVVIAGTVLHHLIIFSSFSLQSIAIPPGMYFGAYSIPSLMFNLIGTLPMYWFLRRIQKRLPQSQSPWVVTPR